MIIVKILFGIISAVISIDDLIKMKRLPDTKLSPEQNLKYIFKFISRGMFVDFFLFCIMLCVIPAGDYGTGIEVLMALIIIAVYGSVLMIFSIRLKYRVRQYYSSIQHNINPGKFKYIDCMYPIAILVKALFVIVDTIWIVEIG